MEKLLLYLPPIRDRVQELLDFFKTNPPIEQIYGSWQLLVILVGARQKAEGRSKKEGRKEKLPQLKLCLDYRTSASQESLFAIALAEQTVQKVQTAWEKGEALTHQERSEVAIAVYTLKAFVTKVGLDISNRMFEVMGARSTAASYGFDRYWRDLRTFTLHDPVDYKLHDIGNFVLNSELPMPSQYS